MDHGLKLPDPATTQGLAFDSKSLNNLKLKAHQDPAQALPKVAKQFESIFTNMMLKAMRSTVPNNGLGDSEQTKMFTGLLDKQLSQSLSQGHGLGLADIMVRQLSPHSSVPHPPHGAKGLPFPSKVHPATADNPSVKGLEAIRKGPSS